jgi:hypothetical protein
MVIVDHAGDLDRLLDQPAEADRDRLDLQLTALHLGDVEQLVDEVLEPIRLLERERLSPAQDPVVAPAREQLETAADRRQRRPQLVRHDADELLLELPETDVGRVADDEDAAIAEAGPDRDGPGVCLVPARPPVAADDRQRLVERLAARGSRPQPVEVDPLSVVARRAAPRRRGRAAG